MSLNCGTEWCDVREIPPACYEGLLERFGSWSALGRSKDGEAEKRGNTKHKPVGKRPEVTGGLPTAHRDKTPTQSRETEHRHLMCGVVEEAECCAEILRPRQAEMAESLFALVRGGREFMSSENRFQYLYMRSTRW